nr:immunoglobulin light chain junction region [Macaca mulatta]MOV79092.1 immunoglobulin light chain junction region [Macaca mulatta]MOV79429.1 immunoglobulin light chain junction region [Macaca mulatta]MOV79944.1 immunoglobulin light chain junction region [Macaca mulatta]MOV80296.1 immunoglobulin light chain junction region [Macaca mulatta]
CMQSLELPFTF